MSKHKGVFANTLDAAENFRSTISCVDCRQTSDQLMHLGTTCKHVFCWNCIRKYDGQNYTETKCPCCMCPIEMGNGKILKSQLFANLSNHTDKLIHLLQKCEAAVEREGGRMALPQQTQLMMESIAREADDLENDPEGVEEKRRKNVEEFFATQQLASSFEQSTPNAKNNHSSSSSVKRSASKTPSREAGKSAAGKSTKSLRLSSGQDTNSLIEMEPQNINTSSESIVVELTAAEREAEPASAHSPELGIMTQRPAALRSLDPLSMQLPPIYSATDFFASTGHSPVEEPTLPDITQSAVQKRFSGPSVLKRRISGRNLNREINVEIKPSHTPPLLTHEKDTLSESLSPELGAEAEQNVTSAHCTPKASVVLGPTIVLGDDTEKESPSTSNNGDDDFSKTPVIIRKVLNAKRTEGQGTVHGLLKDLDPQLMIDDSPVVKTRRRSQTTEPRIFRLISRSDIDGVQAELSKSSSDINSFDSQLWTPLFTAVNYDCIDIAQMLISNGALINAVCGEECNTALHHAIALNLESMAKILLSKGANRKIKNAFGKNPEKLAEGNAHMLKLLNAYRTYPRQPSILPERPSNYCVALLDDGMLSEREMRKFVKLGNITFCEASSPALTHLIVRPDEYGFVPMRMSVLRAIMRGIPVVSLDWIRSCLSQKQLLEEIGTFECESIANEEEKKGTIRNWKLCQLKKTPKLFRGLHFYFLHDHFPSSVRYDEKYDLNFVCELISLGEGTVMLGNPPRPAPSTSQNSIPAAALSTSTRPPPFHNKDIFNDIYIYDVALNSRNINSRTAHRNVELGTLTWLIDSILLFSLSKPY